MHRIINLLILGSALTGCVSTRPSDELAGGESTVRFSTSQSGGNLTIACRPRTEEVGQSTAWVDVCNRLGQDVLANAARKGLIAPVSGPAFGMASEFVRTVPPGAPLSSKELSRELPLIGLTL